MENKVQINNFMKEKHYNSFVLFVSDMSLLFQKNVLCLKTTDVLKKMHKFEIGMFVFNFTGQVNVVNISLIPKWPIM